MRMGWPDGAIPRRGQAGFSECVQKLAAVLGELRPEEVYVTHPADGWADHTAAAQIARAALGRLGGPPRLIQYPVWMWFNAPSPLRRHVDLSLAWRLKLTPEAHARKRAAMGCYLNAPPAPCGLPWCGRLPYGVTAPAGRSGEIYFDAFDARQRAKAEGARRTASQ